MKNNYYAIFGIKKGRPTWDETLIVETTDRQRAADARAWAINSGYIITREYKPEDNINMPDFSKVF